MRFSSSIKVFHPPPPLPLPPIYLCIIIFIFDTSDKNLKCLIIVSPEKPPVPPNSRSYKSSVAQGANN